MSNFKYTSQKDYRTIIVGTKDANSITHQRLIADLKNQRPLYKYRVPQAILEYIDPQWPCGTRSSTIPASRRTKGKFLNLFRF